MKIGLIKETKIPEDNRVILSPKQVKELSLKYPEHQFVVEASPIRAYSDDEYRAEGVEVVDDMADCDVLFGIKEPKIESLIDGKHYFSFGHITKEQPYNRPLIKAFVEKGITFSDYEYLTDEHNVRLCAFGWWAGAVGTYYTLRGYGLRTKSFELPKPDRKFTLEMLIENLRNVQLPAVKVLVTGTGRVSHGAQYTLEKIGATKLSKEEFVSDKPVDKISYFVADLPDMLSPKEGKEFVAEEFFAEPAKFESRFMGLAPHADILLSCHLWTPDAPVYLNAEELKDPSLHIQIIGDITCDIMGSIKSTLRSSTHADPFYDYNPSTEKEEQAFSSDKNITVMAVDTCPNALARDTSAYFGEKLIEHIFPALLGEDAKGVIAKATILKDGRLTDHYSYLSNFAYGD